MFYDGYKNRILCPDLKFLDESPEFVFTIAETAVGDMVFGYAVSSVHKAWLKAGGGLRWSANAGNSSAYGCDLFSMNGCKA